ncbi:hypothetical protein F5Y14DRAFT_335015 [Nemania sp. NC0429]|nr:hypothetical protein F5Y14DRAFT_335015 [Nemania sp. NC0429]
MVCTCVWMCVCVCVCMCVCVCNGCVCMYVSQSVGMYNVSVAGFEDPNQPVRNAGGLVPGILVDEREIEGSTGCVFPRIWGFFFLLLSFPSLPRV